MQVAMLAASAPLETAFADRLVSLLHPSPAHSTLAIALSGGSDSMALTLLADAWARTHGGRIVALTVDHGLRAESAGEARTVHAWMQARGIEHHVLTPPRDAHATNMQASARARRYDALADYCRAHGILHCLVAHHAGDVRETVALHTARGDTADGATGMAQLRNYRGVRFLRPLLGMEHAKLEDYLSRHAVAWVDDPSNHNTDFARVRLRAQLAQDAPHAAELTRTAQREGAARAHRDDILAHAATQRVTLHPAGYAELPLAAWQALEALLASQLLADLLTTIGGATYRPRAKETARLMASLDDGMAKHTLQHCEITCVKGMLRIAREHARVAPAVILSGSGTLTWDGRFHVAYTLPPGYSLTLQALGSSGHRQWKALGYPSLPLSSPSLWHLEALRFVPHMEGTSTYDHEGVRVSIGFAPPKPLAAAPFWWLNDR